MNDMDVSENGGFSPQSIHFNRAFPLFSPSILRCFPIFGNTYMLLGNQDVVNALFFGGSSMFRTSPLVQELLNYIATRLRFPRRIRPFWSFWTQQQKHDIFSAFWPQKFRLERFEPKIFGPFFLNDVLSLKTPLGTQGGKFFGLIFEANQREPPWFIRSEAAP